MPAKERGATAIPVLKHNTESFQGLSRHPEGLDNACSLALLSGFYRERDLTPWPAPAAKKGQEDFPGGADAFLESILRKTLPEISIRLGYEPAWHGIAGYSPAGLFAVYALYRTDVFKRSASVSGSLWSDGFKGFALSTPLAGIPDRVCLPPGSREGRTRDARLSRVKECTEAL